MAEMFTIVLTDDDHDEHELFRESLDELKERQPINLICFNDGEKLIKWLQKAEPQPDVIFLDINMPYLNGFETLLLIKKLDAFKEIPVIMYSTSKSPSDIHKAYSYGANLYMCKLIAVKDLKDKIEEIIDNIQKKAPFNINAFATLSF